MTDRLVFDPRDPRYKKPFGAVRLGTEVTLTLRPLAQEQFSGCTLLLYEEFCGRRREIELPPLGRSGDLFSGSFTAPEAPELIWYAFRFTRRDGGCVWFGRSGYTDENSVQCWQLTVYDDSRPTPDWFGRGVTYQIFPDRYCRTCLPDPAGMPGHRTVHKAWDEGMVYLPDENGEITNSDFFGGNLLGIVEHLDDLQNLSVSTIYLCPIFESDSNHRYNTGDYLKIDPMLGTEADLRRLCEEAEKRHIRVILDGVFNHTGSNSRYFNADGTYPGAGAAQSPDSPYADWFTFSHWPDQYDAWWGIRTLPAVNESAPAYRDFIFRGPDSVVRHWLRCGVSGWRLDVADELPDDFIAELRQAMDEESPGSLLLGEVWEDGSNKVAYSRRRHYLLGDETHGLMNYPFRTAALAWLTGGDAADFREVMETIRENYPAPAFYSAMNFLGTHDTPRILTLLGVDPETAIATRDQRAAYRLSPAERRRGMARLRLGAALMYAFPGSPTVFYGDEAGMEGFEDPFNRGTYPWGQEDPALLRYYRRLGALRQARLSLQQGSITYLCAEGGLLAFDRQWQQEHTLCVLNAGSQPRELTLPWAEQIATDGLSGQQFFVRDELLHLSVPPVSGLLLI